MAEEFENLPVDTEVSESNDQSSGADEDEDLNYLDANEDTNDDEEDESEGDGEDEEVAEQPRKKSNGFKKRIDKLIKEKDELKQRLDALEKGSKPAEKEVKSEKEETLVKPKFEDFDSIDDYNDAFEDYMEKKVLSKFEKHTSEKASKQAQAEERNKEISAYTERLNKAVSERYKDFNEVFTNLNDVPALHDATVRLIQKSEMGPDLVYYLAKNKEKATELAKSSVEDQITKLNKLEQRLSAKLNIKKEEAPAPLNRVTNPRGTVNKKEYSKEMSFEDFMKFREKK